MIFDNLFEPRSLENPQVPLSAENAVDELFGGGTGRTVSPDLAMKSARLCDEHGELLFNPDDVDDLNAISALDSHIIIEFNKAVDAPKASANAESSN